MTELMTAEVVVDVRVERGVRGQRISDQRRGEAQKHHARPLSSISRNVDSQPKDHQLRQHA